MAGDPATGATFVTGDAVNLAKRLEQAAGPGEILIGTATYPLVRDAVKVGPREHFSVKGKQEKVSPFRLHEVDATPPVWPDGSTLRSSAARSSWRAHEAAEACEAQSSCSLLTVMGAAGIGKSRLVAELLERLEGQVPTASRALPPVRRGDHLLAGERHPARRAVSKG